MVLSKENIVKAAIVLLNEGGIGNLSMRSLATFLDTKAASLYRHIKDKEDLYALISEAVISDIKPTCSLGNPKKYLLEAAELYRQKLLSIHDSAKVVTQSKGATLPGHFDFLKNVMICLLHLGVSENKCMVATHMLNNYILSSVLDEVHFRSFSADPPSAYNKILGNNFKWLNFDEQFNYGLEVLFTGFKVLK